MKLLAVETATEACSAALMVNGNITERFSLATNSHSRLILPMIDTLLSDAQLQPADLNGLAFGRGPGSFTGIRIATGIIQGLAFALNLSVVPVSNLAAVAQDFFDQNPENVAFVAMDARMGEIYWGVYQRDPLGFAELLGNESVLPAHAIEFPDITGVGIGTGWKLYSDELSTRLAHRITRYDLAYLPRASAVVRLGAQGFQQGNAVLAHLALPVYLRDQVAKKESERKPL